MSCRHGWVTISYETLPPKRTCRECGQFVGYESHNFEIYAHSAMTFLMFFSQYLGTDEYQFLFSFDIKTADYSDFERLKALYEYTTPRVPEKSLRCYKAVIEKRKNTAISDRADRLRQKLNDRGGRLDGG
jgi:hypothetical protein